MAEGICIVDGKPFAKWNVQQKFCSRACKKKFNNKSFYKVHVTDPRDAIAKRSDKKVQQEAQRRIDTASKKQDLDRAIWDGLQLESRILGLHSISFARFKEIRDHHAEEVHSSDIIAANEDILIEGYVLYTIRCKRCAPEEISARRTHMWKMPRLKYKRVVNGKRIKNAPTTSN